MDAKSRPTQLSPEMRENILRRWEARVRSEMPAASRLSTPVLVDTLPLFMNQLAEAIDPDNQRTLATDGSNVAEEHGGERARLSPLDPSHVVFEYAILRQELEAEFTARGGYPGETRKIVERSIDVATREAMTAYFLVHNSLREQAVRRGPFSRHSQPFECHSLTN